MAKISKVLLIIVLLVFSVGIIERTGSQKILFSSVSVAEEAPDIVKKMYLKDGRIIECDMVWDGLASQILCKKSDNIVAYSAGEVDLIRTFGESRAEKIAERYEEYQERQRQRDPMSRPTIVTPEQERYMHRAEQEQPGRVNKRLIELEKRFLNQKIESYREKHRTASGPPPKGRHGFNEKEFYEKKIQDIEKQIEELERDPEFYFYKKKR